MATLVYEPTGAILYIGSVKACEEWIGAQEDKDSVGVHNGNYGIDMSEEEYAEYQQNP